jgi:ABC-type transporter Mla MlaB component
MKNLTFDISSETEDKQSACINLGGDLSLKVASTLKSKLIEVKNLYNIVEINVADVTNIDLSVIQLLVSLKTTFDASEKELKMNFRLSPEQENLLKISGFEELLTGNKTLAN